MEFDKIKNFGFIIAENIFGNLRYFAFQGRLAVQDVSTDNTVPFYILMHHIIIP